ncbi:GNAT family N-acetyltransferase [Streptomyces sp. NPDC048442]|uniref:GNAT family N-acetyltransferase n=1 Tax=Streptomyces sp. NPDC048442 TaxID=3154823 RepID=UPI00343D341B
MADEPQGPALLQEFVAPGQVTPELSRLLAECWVEVTNSGGAAGFPFPPIDLPEAARAVDALVAGLASDSCRLLTATTGDGALAGWLCLRRDPFDLVAHWGTLHHLQTRPGVRGAGHGAALLEEVRRIARDEMGLEQLHLAARGGAGLEGFYARHGWKEVGRWAGALRFAPEDYRDEVLMLLDPL